MKRILIIAAIIASPYSALAGDWVLGAGTSQFNSIGADDSAIVTAEIHSNPFFNRNQFSLSYMGVITVHSSGDTFLGAGLSALYDFNNHWFLEASVAPGFFNESSAGNDLGSNFEIRSLLGLGYQLQSGDRISLAVTHKSNAGTSNRNPGVDAVLLRYRHSF